MKAGIKKQEAEFIVTDEYREWIALIKDKIKSSQIKASIKVKQGTIRALLAYWRGYCKPAKTFKMGRGSFAADEH